MRASGLASVASEFTNAERCIELLSTDVRLADIEASGWQEEPDSDVLNFLGIASFTLGDQQMADAIWRRSTHLGDGVAPLLLSLLR